MENHSINHFVSLSINAWFKRKPVLKQGTSAEKEFLSTKCYSNLRKEDGMSFTQEETLQSGALEVWPNSIKRRVLEPKEKQVSFQLDRHKKLQQWIRIYYLPLNKTDGFLYVWKSRPGPSFVPALFSIRPLHSVWFFSKSCWILFEFELVSLFVARWWITGCTFKDACSDAETAKHDFLGFTPLTHAPVVL